MGWDGGGGGGDEGREGGGGGGEMGEESGDGERGKGNLRYYDVTFFSIFKNTI